MLDEATMSADARAPCLPAAARVGSLHRVSSQLPLLLLCPLPQLFRVSEALGNAQALFGCWPESLWSAYSQADLGSLLP